MRRGLPCRDILWPRPRARRCPSPPWSRRSSRVGSPVPGPPCAVGWSSTGFAAKPGELCLVPGKAGKLARVLVGCEGHDELWALAALPQSLPQGVYRLDAAFGTEAATKAALGWALGTYRFERYRKETKPLAALAWPKGADRAAVERCRGRHLPRPRSHQHARLGHGPGRARRGRRRARAPQPRPRSR